MGYKKQLANTSARKRIGITQEDYIPYLWDANRSTLAMYENGKRSLPFEASIRNTAIEIAFSKPETETATEERAQQQKLAAAQVLAKRHQECLLLIMKAQAQLAKMQQQYQQCLDLARVAAIAPAILTELFPNNGRHTEDMNCLASFGRTAGYKMEHCGIGKQQLLQLKIDALQFEADKIQQLLQQ